MHRDDPSKDAGHGCRVPPVTDEAPAGRERMSDVEALMWSLEADPHLSSTFANLTLFDRSPDHDRLRRRLWRATRVVPRLRRRVVAGPGLLTPSWEDDPAFDLDQHVRREVLGHLQLGADAREAGAKLVRCSVVTYTAVIGSPECRKRSATCWACSTPTGSSGGSP